MDNNLINSRILFLNGIQDSGLAVVYNNNGNFDINTMGSSNIYQNMGNYFKNYRTFTLDARKKQKIKPEDFNLIFNQISNPETHITALKKAAHLCTVYSQQNIYCINHPEKVLNTTRYDIAKTLKNISQLNVPEVFTFKPETPTEIYSKIEELNWDYPVIFRERGAHGGKNMILLKKPYNESDFYPVNLDGREYYLIKYIDYKNKKGIYCKYRIAVVDGEPFLRHVIFSNEWKIHSSSRTFMAENPEYYEQEEEIIKNFESKLKPRLYEITQKIYERISLDYFGIDCSINDTINIFEVNANMNILYNNLEKPNIFEYQIEKIKEAIAKMVKRRCRE